jgi:hypothetical protein
VQRQCSTERRLTSYLFNRSQIPDHRSTRVLEVREMTEQTIRVDLYAIVRRAVEEGTTYALARATKHVEWSHYDLERGELGDKVVDSVLDQLCEVIQFGEFE